MHNIVTIIGTDGSGKTTLSNAVVDGLRAQGLDAAREWLGAESFIAAPVRKLLKMRWRKLSPGNTQTADSGSNFEVAQKQAMVAKFRWAKRLYLTLILTDYRLQLAVKLRRNRHRDVLVADRYAFDVLVNLALTYGLTPAETVHFVQRQITKLQLPQVRVFLRVEPEVSMQRKDDIPDIDYLRLRFAHYEAVAEAFGFVVLDGSLPIEHNAKWLIQNANRMMQAGHVHYVHANNVDMGGADLVLVSMAEQMRSTEDAYRPSVSLRLATSAVDLHANRGTPVLLAPFIRPQLAAGPSGIMRLALQGPLTVAYFYRLFGRQGPDIVHVNDLYDFLPALAAKVRGIPVVYHIRMIRTGLVRRGFSWLVPRLSDVTVSVSEAVRSVYGLESSTRGRHCVVHDLGNSTLVRFTGDVGVTQPRPPGFAGAGRLVVMVGRIQEWKGQRVFLEAIRLLPDHIRTTNVFAIVGGGVQGREEYWGDRPYLDAVTAHARELGVRCVGERADIPEILLASDVSVHCSVQPDPFPGVVVESLLAGAATVGVDSGGVPEMIDSPDVGITYPAGDALALSQHLRELLSKTEDPRSVYSARARGRALQLVSPGAIYAKIDDIYQALLTTTSRTRVCDVDVINASDAKPTTVRTGAAKKSGTAP
ncbi:glycosyltransferase [Mycolicibacterium neoaurum]|uniref:glycosyltransferase n=1 Tax=Mycolicibacterium neoaurum TaxID=1795 RepID=UPI002671F52D|nr:glycosyltransferase [Mycolicibacterium neoaurum]MDO3400738.1 glycosyltransferase [Mycolicibacterium neoaurum]